MWKKNIHNILKINENELHYTRAADCIIQNRAHRKANHRTPPTKKKMYCRKIYYDSEVLDQKKSAREQVVLSCCWINLAF